MKIRRTMQWLALGLVVPLLGGATEAVTPDAAGGSAARCTITIKAHLDPGSLGRDGASLSVGGSSRVRIKSGTWSKLGNDDSRDVNFLPDGTWTETKSDRGRTFNPGSGTGEWSGQVLLNMGCRYNRRYEFRIQRNGQHGTIVRPQYPSTSTWTRSQTIDLGNLARYF
jgi:hypothetical protein